MSLNNSINPRIVNLKESATLRINQRVRNARSKGEEIYHFGFGQAAFPIHEKIVNSLSANASSKDYLPGLGLGKLRQEVAEFYKREFNYDVDSNCVAIGPGSKEFLFQSLMILDGDLIIPQGSWVSYGPQAMALGKEVHILPTSFEDGYKLSASELRSFCLNKKKSPRIIILNSPNNPTGSVYTELEIQEISKICEEYNIIILSDEIYAQVDFTGETKKGFYHYYPKGTIVTGGLSKAHSAGGWRLGTLFVHKSNKLFLSTLAALISETFSCVNSPVQHAAVVAYSNDSEIKKYLEITRDIYKQVSLYMWKRFTKMKVKTPRPQGAFYLCPDFSFYKDVLLEKHGIKTCVEFTEFILDEAKVGMLPGSEFYFPEDSLCCRVANVDFDGKAVLQKGMISEDINERFVIENCPNIVNGLNSLETILEGLLK